MEFCSNCGLLLPAGADRCPQCGAPVPPTAPLVRPDAGQSGQTAGPAHPFYAGAKEEARAGMSTAGYLGCLVLFAIPVVGLILMLVWSLDHGRHPARRNLARAYLIRTLILSAIFFVVVAVLLFAASLTAPYIYYYPYYY